MELCNSGVGIVLMLQVNNIAKQRHVLSGFDKVDMFTRIASIQVGTVKPSVARTYYIATGRALSVLIIVALFLMQFSKNGADWWLSRWTKDQSNFSSKYVF